MELGADRVQATGGADNPSYGRLQIANPHFVPDVRPLSATHGLRNVRDADIARGCHTDACVAERAHERLDRAGIDPDRCVGVHDDLARQQWSSGVLGCRLPLSLRQPQQLNAAAPKPADDLVGPVGRCVR